MFRRIGSALILIAVLLSGLFLPEKVQQIAFHRIDGAKWATSEAKTEYQYHGTLENRVRVLEAWQSRSPAINHLETKGDADIAADLWHALYTANLLPTDYHDPTRTVNGFRLVPGQYRAEYAYAEIICEAEGARLRAILDRESNLCVQIEFSCAPEVLEAWMRNTGVGFATQYKWDQLLKNYAAYLGYANLSESTEDYTGGEIIQRHEAHLPNTALAVALNYSTQQGLLIYKLTPRALAQ